MAKKYDLLEKMIKKPQDFLIFDQKLAKVNMFD